MILRAQALHSTLIIIPPEREEVIKHNVFIQCVQNIMPEYRNACMCVETFEPNFRNEI